MTTITPPSAPQAPPAPTGTVPVAVVQSPPPALARLAVGQLLQATVTGQMSKDVFQVQTPLGQLSVQSNIALPKEGALVLQLQSLSPSVQFQINTVNGAIPPLAPKVARPAPLSGQTQGLGAASPGAAGKGVGQAAQGPKMTPGSVLQATLMRPLSQTNPGTGQQPLGRLSSPVSAATGLSAAKGQQAPVNVAKPLSGASLTAAPNQPAGKTPLPGASHGQTGATNPALAKGSPGKVSQSSGYLPTGSQLNVKIKTVQLPNPVANNSAPDAPSSAKTAPSLTPGTTLRGTVTGSTPSGHPIVQTRAGVFALTTQTVIPRGSVITLDVVSAPSAPPLKTGTLPTLHETMFSSRKWPALEEIFQVVQENNPAAAQQLIHSIVPKPDVSMASSIIFFLSALRGGDIRNLLGDDILRLIERTRPNLAGRIRDDFNTLSRVADEPSSGDWRVALIPLNTGAEIEQIRMLLRQHGGEEENEESGKSNTRFVVDVALSQLGRVQLDGLVRHHGKSLDLIIRSETPFSQQMHNDIRDIFQNAAELTGLKGGVNFQASPPDFIDISDPTGKHDLGFVV